MDMLSYLLGKQAGGSGGSSPWTKLAEDDFTVSTSSTSATEVGTISCGAAAWTDAKMVYVRVRDKAGKRNGYFLGTDSFFINSRKPNGSTVRLTNMPTVFTRVESGGYYASANSTNGVFPNSIESNGDIPIYAKYASGATIDGTFHVEVYTLEWPDNVSPFA